MGSPAVNTTIDVLFVASLPIILIVGWVTAVVLVVIGYRKHSKGLDALGTIGLGLMTMTTPLSYYVYETFRLGMYEARAADFLLLSVLTLIGGIIVGYGITWWMREPP